MTRETARRYLLLSVRLPRDDVSAMLETAERDGKAAHERATVTFDQARGTWEVKRPGFAHGFGSYNYLDNLHPVDCTLCYCAHHRHRIGTGTLRSEPPSTCVCGHQTSRHRFRVVSETLDVCKAPATWYTDDMRTFNALAGLLTGTELT